MLEDVKAARIYVELPNGAWLIPGESPGCSGPTPGGACPVARHGAVRPCTGGVWFMPGSRGWRVELKTEDALCPLTFLDPLGPIALPLD